MAQDKIGGLPVVIDKNCPPGKVFLIDSRYFPIKLDGHIEEPDYPNILIEIESLDVDGGK